MSNDISGEVQADHATVIKNILQDIAITKIRCREFTKLKKCEQADAVLARAKELYSDLLSATDLENPVHRSIVRNRRLDLGEMAADVESCHLRQEAERLRRERRRGAAKTEAA